ncbi:MAG: DUF488 family protein [Ectothiorhodospiraceae bacterium]|nr:DUF488 family protein [Ectothiorhodospiraceae bacterium]
MTEFRAKRVYDPPAPDDGVRVLVDRIWPRGMTREQVGAELWAKDLSPSTGLRKWFNHDRSRWEAFQERYFDELDRQPAAVAAILEKARDNDRLTLLFAARDPECNHAKALQTYLRRKADAG